MTLKEEGTDLATKMASIPNEERDYYIVSSLEKTFLHGINQAKESRKKLEAAWGKPNLKEGIEGEKEEWVAVTRLRNEGIEMAKDSPLRASIIIQFAYEKAAELLGINKSPK